MSLNAIVQVVEGQSKKTGNDYKAIDVFVGDWQYRIFPRSRFEVDYIEKYLATEKQKNIYSAVSQAKSADDKGTILDD